jgi:hypothetical protein
MRACHPETLRSGYQQLIQGLFSPPAAP